MTTEVRELAAKLARLGYHTVPLSYKTKLPPNRSWETLRIGLSDIDAFYPAGKNHNIGLLLSTEITDSVFIVAFDIDLEDDLLISRVRMAVGPGAIRKKGKKGVTLLARSAVARPTKRMQRKVDGRNVMAVELLGQRTQTVIPPSVHPETNEPYVWIGKSLDEVDPSSLPLVTDRTLDEVLLAARTPDSPFFQINEMSWSGPGGGGTVDSSILAASAVLVQRGWTDDEIEARIRRSIKLCLHGNPHAAEWDERLFSTRLANVIGDARRKGFADHKPRNAKGDRRVAVTDSLIEKLGGLDQLWRDVNMLRQYSEGCWPQVPDRSLEHTAINLDASWMMAADAEAVARTAIMRAPERWPSRSEPKICLKNGTLHVLSGQLLEWNAGDLLTAQLPFNYDETALCPTYDAFVAATFESDMHGKVRSTEEMDAHVAAFNEFMGLTLIDDVSFERMLVVQGPPLTGKSTLMNVVRLIHDPRAISTVSVHQIAQERYITTMVGKLVNISGEVPAGALVEEQLLKSIISGDGVTVRKLYEEVNDDVRITARVLTACNELFRVRDSSGAVERRLLILQTRKSLPEHLKDRGLMDKLRAETPGIFNRAVAALRRLKARGYFVAPEDAKRMTIQFTEESNHVVVWIKERSHEGQRMDDHEYEMPDKLAPMLSADLYSDYVEWVQNNGFKQMSSVTWGTRLTAMGYAVKVVKVGGRSCRVRDLHLISNGSGAY